MWNWPNTGWDDVNRIGYNIATSCVAWHLYTLNGTDKNKQML